MLCVILFGIIRPNISKTIFTCVSLCAIGATYFAIQRSYQRHMRDSCFLNIPVHMQGTIQNIQHNTQDKLVSNITISSSRIFNSKYPALTTQKNISLQVPYQKAIRFKVGQQIHAKNVVLQQPDYQTEYGLYALKENIWATGYVATQQCYIKKQNLKWYYRWFNFLTEYYTSYTAYLYNPLFLGYKTKNNNAIMIQHQSAYWGIAHHMARSGIHIITLLGLCISIFHYARIRTRFKFILYGLLSLIYASISVPSISFIRALCMIMIQMFTRFNGYQYSGLHAFALTTLMLVLYNPFIVLFLDFQLSFGITAVIIWLFYVKWAKTVVFPLSPFLRY